MDWMTVNDELRKMWKEAVMAYFKVLLPHLFGGNDGNLSEYLASRQKFETGIPQIQGILLTT
jgi:hypothetical protein